MLRRAVADRTVPPQRLSAGRTGLNKATPIRLAYAVALALLSGWMIFSELPRALPGHGLWDFGSFVASGRAAREGLNPYGVYPLTLRVELPGFEAWNPNLNPPISALLFQLFDLADPEVTFEIW